MSEPGTCNCGAAPIDADGLCATCLDEAFLEIVSAAFSKTINHEAIAFKDIDWRAQDFYINFAAEVVKSSNEQSCSRRCEATCAGKEELDELKSSLTQAQARATAAEGEIPLVGAFHRSPQECPAWHDTCNCTVANYAGQIDYTRELLTRAEFAQQTITQLTRELETARLLLKPFAEAHDSRPDINDAHPDYDKGDIWESPSAMCISYGDLRKAASFLSSLSHQDEQG